MPSLINPFRIGVEPPPEPGPDASLWEQAKWHAHSMKYQVELKALEAAKNLGKTAFHKATEISVEHAPDVLVRTPGSLFDRISPKYPLKALSRPQAIAEHDQQYLDILTNYAHMVMHPVEHARENFGSIRHPLGVGRFFLGRMDRDSWSSPLMHTTRAMGEEVKDQLSDLIVMMAITKTILAIPRNKQKVEGMRDWLFPRSSLRWRWMRNPIGNIFVTNSPSRLLALPHVFGAMLLYHHLGSVGRAMENEEALRNNPETKGLHSDLKAMNKQYILANVVTDMIDHFDKTSRIRKPLG